MWRTAILLVALLFLPARTWGHDHPPPSAPAAAQPCTEISLACAKTATPAFGGDGRMWLIWSAGGKMMVSASSDMGASFAPAVQISEPANAMDDNGEARPALLVTRTGTLVAMWGQRVDNRYNGKLFFARSTDAGRSFGPQQPLLDGIGQRFPALAQTADGRIHAAWLDTRNRVAALAAGRDYKDTGVAVAWSDDDGASFDGKAIQADYACDCCRVAMTLDGGGKPLIGWRHVFPGSRRDHAVARLDGQTLGPPVRVSEDDWAVDACPRHGPALATDPDGGVAMVWYTGGKRRKGLFFARSEDGGHSFSEPQGFGAPDRVASHPQILAHGGRLWRAWKEFDGTATTVMAQTSADHGRNWDEGRPLATTTDASDHPLLVKNGPNAYLSWLTRADGYRLVALP